MKKYFSLIALAAILSPSSYSSTKWKIDEELKFNFTYYPKDTDYFFGGKSITFSPLLKHIPAYSPDIENITYKGLLDLGFPLPNEQNPEQHRFLLKIYPFPEVLNPEQSVARVLNPFSLEGVEGLPEIESFLKERDNLAVKFAVLAKEDALPFSQNKPLKNFSLPVSSRVQTQAIFDQAIPFTSIYLNPPSSLKEENKNEKYKAEASSKGVKSFHESLVKTYKSKFLELKGTKQSHYFAHYRSCVNFTDRLCEVTVIEVPREILTFKDYRQLPMPHDPARIFLSGLLLVKSSSYYVGDMKIQTRDFERTEAAKILKEGKLNNSHLLEVGSVVKF